VFTARYGLIPYIKQITFRLLKVNTAILSGQARSHICLAYVVGLNFLTFGVPRKLVRLKKICLIETYSRVRVSKYLSDRFPIRNGLKQGDALSPLLFNFALPLGGFK
jgi:hypothetical protein